MDELPLALAGGFENSSVNLYHNRFRDIRPAAPLPVKIGVYCAVCATQISEMLGGHDLVVGEPASNLPNQLNRSANTFTNCQDGVFVQNRYRLKMRGNTLTGGTNTGVFMRLLQDNTQLLERNTLANNSLGIFIGNSNGVSATVRNNTITGNNTATRRGIRLDLIDHLGVAQGVYPVQITNNTIDLFGDGIWLNEVHHVNVENNPAIKVRRLNGTDLVRGIHVNSCTRVRIANNLDIFSTSASGGATNLNTRGIDVVNSPETMVLCNGIHDIARCAVFSGQCFPSDFLKNTMQRAVDGFVLIDGVIGEQGNDAIPGVQAKASENKWLGNVSSWNSWTLVITNDQQFRGFNSRFFVRQAIANQNPTGTMNQAIGNTGFAMSPVPLSGGSIQGVNCTDIFPGNRTAGGVKAVVTERLQGNGPAIHAAQFRRDEWAYTALLREPSLASGEPLIQAYQAAQTGTSLAATADANEEILVPDSAQASIYALQILQQSQSEVNHKAVLAIRLNNNDLSLAEIAQLQGIAALCEAIGGKAVNIAKGLLATEGIMIWDDPGCPGNAKTSVGFGSSDSDIGSKIEAMCWPNPTDGELFLKFSDGQAGGTIEVFDASGRRLLHQAFESSGEPIKLNGSEWSQGLVLVKVQLQDGTFFNWRVLLQR